MPNLITMGFPYKRSIYLTDFSKFSESIYMPNDIYAEWLLYIQKPKYLEIYTNRFLDDAMCYCQVLAQRIRNGAHGDSR